MAKVVRDSRVAGKPPALIEYLRNRYDALLERWETLGEFLDDESIPLARREERLPEYLDLMLELDSVIVQHRNLGSPMTRTQILRGFGPDPKDAMAYLLGLSKTGPRRGTEKHTERTMNHENGNNAGSGKIKQGRIPELFPA